MLIPLLRANNPYILRGAIIVLQWERPAQFLYLLHETLTVTQISIPPSPISQSLTHIGQDHRD